MRNRKSAPHRALMACAGILLGCLLVSGPAAQAAFTGSASAGALTAGAHKLAVPTGNEVTATCTATGNSGKYRLTIDVTSHGTVAKASHYVLTVVEPNGTNRYTEDLKPAGEHKSKPEFESKTAGPGQWSYSIDAQYRVPGSTNIWTSDSTQSSVTVNCPSG